MQLSSLLFVQLPAFVANLTNPTSTSSALSLPSPAPAVAATTLANMSDELQTYTLPPLPYEYNALEPYISEQIMKLHHQKHHQAYITNLNNALASQARAVNRGSVRAQIALQVAIKFHGGGHINHSLFWRSLCRAGSPYASPDSAPSLVAAINKQYGSLDIFQSSLKALLLGIQGSGWGWVVKRGGRIELVTTKDQDPITDGRVVFGIDMWEHAYYLQYWNDKGAYCDAIWNVVNWERAEGRWSGSVSEEVKL